MRQQVKINERKQTFCLPAFDSNNFWFHRQWKMEKHLFHHRPPTSNPADKGMLHQNQTSLQGTI